MLSLRWKLVFGLLLVVAVSVGLTAYLTNRGTTSEFSHYLARSRMGQEQNSMSGIGALAQPPFTDLEQEFLNSVDKSTLIA